MNVRQGIIVALSCGGVLGCTRPFGVHIVAPVQGQEVPQGLEVTLVAEVRDWPFGLCGDVETLGMDSDVAPEDCDVDGLVRFRDTLRLSVVPLAGGAVPAAVSPTLSATGEIRASLGVALAPGWHMATLSYVEPVDSDDSVEDEADVRRQRVSFRVVGAAPGVVADTATPDTDPSAAPGEDSDTDAPSGDSGAGDSDTDTDTDGSGA